MHAWSWPQGTELQQQGACNHQKQGKIGTHHVKQGFLYERCDLRDLSMSHLLRRGRRMVQGGQGVWSHQAEMSRTDGSPFCANSSLPECWTHLRGEPQLTWNQVLTAIWTRQILWLLLELWATWSGGRCPCLWQGGWNLMIFKVPSNPYHSMILWSLLLSLLALVFTLLPY